MNDIQEAVCRRIRKETLAQIAMELVDIPSFPYERAAAEYVARRFGELGMDHTLQEVEQDRWNVLLRLRGSGGGKTLLFSGHLDTSSLGDDVRYPERCWVPARRDGIWLYGLGMSNMKNAFAGYYEAIRALLEEDVPRRGDILVGGVVGETERGAPDGEHGPHHRGNGLGSYHLATHGLAADFAIIGEPTGLRLTVGETGMIFAKVTVAGVPQHTWCKEYGVDPILKMQKVMDAIRAWEPELKRLHPHPFMDARLGIGAIEGGQPFKPSRCPAPSCSIFVDLRIPPPSKAIDVKRELQCVLDRLIREDPELKVDLDFYVTHPGFEIDRDQPVVGAVERAYEAVFEEPIRHANDNRYCVSSDGSPYWQVGIPSLHFGAGGIQREGQLAVYGSYGEALNLDKLHRATQVYALAALELCA